MTDSSMRSRKMVADYCSPDVWLDMRLLTLRTLPTSRTVLPSVGGPCKDGQGEHGQVSGNLVSLLHGVKRVGEGRGSREQREGPGGRPV